MPKLEAWGQLGGSSTSGHATEMTTAYFFDVLSLIRKSYMLIIEKSQNTKYKKYVKSYFSKGVIML